MYHRVPSQYNSHRLHFVGFTLDTGFGSKLPTQHHFAHSDYVSEASIQTDDAPLVTTSHGSKLPQGHWSHSTRDCWISIAGTSFNTSLIWLSRVSCWRFVFCQIAGGQNLALATVPACMKGNLACQGWKICTNSTKIELSNQDSF